MRTFPLYYQNTDAKNKYILFIRYHEFFYLT